MIVSVFICFWTWFSNILRLFPCPCSNLWHDGRIWTVSASTWGWDPQPFRNALRAGCVVQCLDCGAECPNRGAALIVIGNSWKLSRIDSELMAFNLDKRWQEDQFARNCICLWDLECGPKSGEIQTWFQLLQYNYPFWVMLINNKICSTTLLSYHIIAYP